MKDEEIRDLLLHLAIVTKEIVKSEKVNGLIKPESELFEHWGVTSFSYDDTGCHVGKSGTQITKPSWIRGLFQIREIVIKTDEYRQLMDDLKTKTSFKEIEPNPVSRFLHKIVSEYLEDETIPEVRLHVLIDNFIMDIQNKPVKSGAIVQVSGIILHSDEIEIAPGVLLRKPKKEDFEIDIPVQVFRFFPHVPDPTAFLEISLQTKMPTNIQEEVTKAITILRLFKPGSVKWNTYRMYSESVSQFLGGTMTSGESHSAIDNYILQDNEIKNLKNFWMRLSSILPPIFYRFDVGKVDHISIAYNRYTDSLLQNGLNERRIANAIMGLEALYFKPTGELQELQYRLGIRVAKMLGKLNFDPIKIRCAIKDAYTIRSIFSHGGHLSYKEKRKYEAKYDGNIKNLLKLILDYLRVSIIVSMTIRSEKDEFIDIIDNAMIDDAANQRLLGVLNQAKNILEFNKGTPE
ncbi:MAG: HEPN domain-containing protein [Methanoregula sp.]|nr:HEPN domain-containing protein [Methanoregula sp.]